MKGENHFDRLNNKQHKSKKSKGKNKLHYDEMKEKLLKNYNISNPRITKTAGEERNKMMISTKPKTTGILI